jgi:galactose-1-phosphate uridylyltransferase
LGDWHWYLEIAPRLTRIAGFEWSTGFHINPVTPEEAARYLRQRAGQGGFAPVRRGMSSAASGQP